MSEPLDELYLQWLYREVISMRSRDPRRTYWRLFRQLYRKEFVWLVPNDDNRVEDGRELRREFFKETGADFDDEWSELGCSLLEMLIALSRRLSFEADGKAREWFWTFLNNLGIAEFSDDHYANGIRAEEVIDTILDRMIWRQYDHDGRGGLFPLEFPDRDQKDVEIWYQMNAYLLEN